MQIYIHRNNQQLGPFTEAEIKAQLASGAISLQDHVWWQGQQGWVPLSQTPLAGGPLSATPIVPGTPAAAAYPAGSVMAPTTNLALLAMICGIVGCLLICPSYLCAPVFILGLVPTIAAIVLGHMALSAIKKNPELKGHGMAIAGLVMGYFSAVMVIVYIVIIVVFVSLNHNIKDVFNQIERQLNSEQTTNSADQSATNPDQTPASVPATNNTPDQSTNSVPASTNSPDSNTNSSAQSTNAPDSSTNAAPMNQ